jgi:branched-chain amino acid transport system substrate-binding protein
VIRGRIVKTTGDGVLLEFPSIVAAVECAVAQSPNLPLWRSGRQLKLAGSHFHLLNNVSSSVGSSLRSAGFHNVLGTVSTAYFKQPGDPAWANDAAYRDWAAFMDNYFLGGRPRTSSETVYGYLAAQTLVEVLKRCGDDLTRDNIMKQAAGLEKLELGMLLPGITIDTGPNDYAPLEQMQMQRFGYEWELFGPVITGEGGAR